jgi:hypothetical protein
MLIFFNHFPKTGGTHLFYNYIFGNENVIFLDEDRYCKSIVEYQLNNMRKNKNNFLYYHDWLPQYDRLASLKKHLNFKQDFSFCFIRNPIEIFYSAFIWIKKELNLSFDYAFKEWNSLNLDYKNFDCPYDLIDLIEQHYNKINIKTIFPNNLFIYNDFSEYDLIFDYEDLEKNICLLTSEFNFEKRMTPLEGKKLYESYGMTKMIDKSYKLDFVQKFLYPSMVVYENLKDKIKECYSEKYFIKPNNC